MTDKQRAIDAIRKLPEAASLEDIMEELFFRQKVERGLDDLAHGRIVTHDDAKRRVARWLQA